MAGDTITKTSNISFGSTAYPILPASNCIPWVIIGIIECLAIVILNLITVVLFVKQHQLQRRSRYLIIHLAIIDLLVGGASGPLFIINGMSNACFHWELSEAFIFYCVYIPSGLPCQSRRYFSWSILCNIFSIQASINQEMGQWSFHRCYLADSFIGRNIPTGFDFISESR